MGWDDGVGIVGFEGCSVEGETYSGHVGGLLSVLLVRFLWLAESDKRRCVVEVVYRVVCKRLDSQHVSRDAG